MIYEQPRGNSSGYVKMAGLRLLIVAVMYSSSIRLSPAELQFRILSEISQKEL